MKPYYAAFASATFVCLHTALAKFIRSGDYFFSMDGIPIFLTVLLFAFASFPILFALPAEFSSSDHPLPVAILTALLLGYLYFRFFSRYSVTSGWSRFWPLACIPAINIISSFTLILLSRS